MHGKEISNSEVCNLCIRHPMKEFGYLQDPDVRWQFYVILAQKKEFRENKSVIRVGRH